MVKEKISYENQIWIIRNSEVYGIFNVLNVELIQLECCQKVKKFIYNVMNFLNSFTHALTMY